MRSTDSHDRETLAFYEREAQAYAERYGRARSHPALSDFLHRLPPGAAVIELGCGGGQDAEAMIAQGFAVTATDGSPALARQAQQRLGRPVRVMRFDELDAEAAYDGVWASACLLHAPMGALPDILARIRRALRPGGAFFASFKAGDGEGRDGLGRYYNFPTREALEAAYRAAGWTDLAITEHAGGGYDGVDRTWLAVMAVKGDR